MTDAELERVVVALRAGKRFGIRGADGEWGYERAPDGRYRGWSHVPYEDAPDRLVDEDEVRRDLAPLSFEAVWAALR